MALGVVEIVCYSWYFDSNSDYPYNESREQELRIMKNLFSRLRENMIGSQRCPTMFERLKTENEHPAAPDQERPLYPRRVFETIQKDAKEIRRLLDESKSRPPVPEKEMRLFHEFENRLGERLEEIDDIAYKETTFSIEYLADYAGRIRFREVFGFDAPDTTDKDELSSFLFRNRSEILTANPKRRSDFAKESRGYQEAQIFEALRGTMNTNGRIDTTSTDFPVPERTILLDPTKCLEKIWRLRAFKKDLRKRWDDLETAEVPENVRELLTGTINLYAERANEILINTLLSIPSLTRKRGLLGESSLTEEEAELLSQPSAGGDIERNFSRLDQLIHGTETHKERWNKQVGLELEALADRIEQESLDSVMFADKTLREKGLDPKKIQESNLTTDVVREMGEEMISAYNLLSKELSDTYDPDRKGPASDGKWQFIQEKGRKSFAVNGKKKILIGPEKELTLKALPVLQHESSHILQHENKEHIPLRLLRKLSGGRWSTFAECGAMVDQARVTREIFGTAETAHPHYIRAMKRRLEGGTYLDCVQAFHDSTLRKIVAQKETGVLSSTEEVRKESEKALSEAINRVFRLFPNAADLGASSGILLRTKDTAYLEQTEVFKAFRSQGLEKLLYIGGVNADALKFLARTGLLRLEDIREPKLHALEIWKRIKNRYMSEKLTDSV